MTLSYYFKIHEKSTNSVFLKKLCFFWILTSPINTLPQKWSKNTKLVISKAMKVLRARKTYIAHNFCDPKFQFQKVVPI